MIDYKGGKIVWDNSYNWELPDHDYAYDQDILQIKYGEHCVIDVGNYSDGSGSNHHFVILVIDYEPYPDDENKPQAWDNPYAVIPCQDKADLLIQLRRAIDVYPNMIG